MELPTDVCHLSSDRDKALRVHCIPLCGPTLLERTVRLNTLRQRMCSPIQCRIIRVIAGWSSADSQAYPKQEQGPLRAPNTYWSTPFHYRYLYSYVRLSQFDSETLKSAWA